MGDHTQTTIKRLGVVLVMLGLLLAVLPSLAADEQNPVADLTANSATTVQIANIPKPFVRCMCRHISRYEAVPCINGTLLAPLREVAELCDATIDYDGMTGTITVDRATDRHVFKVGSRQYSVNGTSMQLPVPVMRWNNELFISVRTLVEFYGGWVEWREETRQATVICGPTIVYKVNQQNPFRPRRGHGLLIVRKR